MFSFRICTDFRNSILDSFSALISENKESIISVKSNTACSNLCISFIFSSFFQSVIGNSCQRFRYGALHNRIYKY